MTNMQLDSLLKVCLVLETSLGEAVYKTDADCRPRALQADGNRLLRREGGCTTSKLESNSHLEWGIHSVSAVQHCHLTFELCNQSPIPVFTGLGRVQL